MTDVTQLLPNLSIVLSEDGPGRWIYLAMLTALVVRTWLTFWLLTSDRCGRQAFLGRTFTLAEALANAALLLGVLGTLSGVAMAANSKGADTAATDFMQTFSAAFGLAVSTTFTGGLSYIYCYLLSSFDEYVAGAEPKSQ